MSQTKSFFSLPRLTFFTVVLVLGLALVMSFVSTVQAQTPVPGGASDVFGTIDAPAGVEKYNSSPGAAGGLGIMVFISNIIRFSTIIAGIWVFINFILAGWIYITSAGDKGAGAKVSEKMTMSIMGLMIIVGAYTIAALLGLIIFGDASYILNPKLKGIL